MSTLENSYKKTYINFLIHQITTPLIPDIHQETPVDREQVKRQNFRQYIHVLILRRNMIYDDVPLADKLSQEMMTNIDVFLI